MSGMENRDFNVLDLAHSLRDDRHGSRPREDRVPQPNGNATVVLRPVNEGTGFRLTSKGSGFGDAGFYRVHRSGDDFLIWRVGRLDEDFHLYVDEEGCVRGDHEIRFFGMGVTTLHCRIAPM